MEDKKADLVWNVTMLERYFEEDDNIRSCDAIMKIVDIIESIIEITKRSPNVLQEPGVNRTFKIILEFSNQLNGLVRGRSWVTSCPKFSPEKSLGDIKTLKTVNEKKPRRIRNPPTPIGEKNTNTSEPNYLEKLRALREDSRVRLEYVEYLTKDTNNVELNMDSLF